MPSGRAWRLTNAREPEALLTHVLDPSSTCRRNTCNTSPSITRDAPTREVSRNDVDEHFIEREKDAVDTLLRSNIEELSSTGKSRCRED